MTINRGTTECEHVNYVLLYTVHGVLTPSRKTSFEHEVIFVFLYPQDFDDLEIEPHCLHCCPAKEHQDEVVQQSRADTTHSWYRNCRASDGKHDV